jgi:hypothetical protein
MQIIGTKKRAKKYPGKTPGHQAKTIYDVCRWLEDQTVFKNSVQPLGKKNLPLHSKNHPGNSANITS